MGFKSNILKPLCVLIIRDKRTLSMSYWRQKSIDCAIIQSRMGLQATWKVLMDLNGIPMLQYQVDRVVKSKLIEQVVVATSTLPQDEEIADFVKKMI